MPIALLKLCDFGRCQSGDSNESELAKEWRLSRREHVPEIDFRSINVSLQVRRRAICELQNRKMHSVKILTSWQCDILTEHAKNRFVILVRVVACENAEHVIA